MKIRRFSLLCAAAIPLLVAVPIALAKPLPGGAKYVGETEKGHTVSVRLTGDAKHVKRMRIHYTVTCDNGRTGDTYTDILNVPVRSNHSFKGSGVYKGSGDGSDNKFRVSGTVSARRASGKFSLTATGTPSGESSPVHCRTGKLSWSADRVK